jgi:hypothetical protein
MLPSPPADSLSGSLQFPRRLVLYPSSENRGGIDHSSEYYVVPGDPLSGLPGGSLEESGVPAVWSQQIELIEFAGGNLPQGLGACASGSFCSPPVEDILRTRGLE